MTDFPSSPESGTAEIPVRVIQILATTEQQDIDFVLTRLGLSLHGTIAREVVASFRRQIIAVAAQEAATVSSGLAQTPAVTAALQECVSILELVEQPAFVDPDYGDEVAALGDRIGYGALMSSASASWRERLKDDDCPTGGEFVAGPCYATVIRALRMARTALAVSSTGGNSK